MPSLLHKTPMQIHAVGCRALTSLTRDFIRLTKKQWSVENEVQLQKYQHALASVAVVLANFPRDIKPSRPHMRTNLRMEFKK